MKNITVKLLKILLVIIITFTSVFNNISVQAMETIKSLMDSENVEKVYSSEFNNYEEANTSRLEKIAELEAIKNEKSKDGISYLYYVSDLEQSRKTVPTTIEDLKENITKYQSIEVIKTKLELEEAKKALIAKYEALEDENNIYDVTITLESNNPVIVDTEYNTVTYDTLNDALEEIGDKDLTPVEVYDETKNVKVDVNKTCTDKTTCEAELAEIEANSNYIVSLEVVSSDSENPTGENITLEGFETKTFINDVEGATEYAEELRSAILEYISENAKNTELQKVNITTVNLDTLNNILSSNTEVVYQVSNTNVGTFKSEEAARAAVVSYVNNLKTTNELINVEKSLENITITPNKGETVIVSTLFDSEEAALAEFARLQEKENNYTLLNPQVRGIDQIITSDSSNSESGGVSEKKETWSHLHIDAVNEIIILDANGNQVGEPVIGKVKLNKVTVTDKNNRTREIKYGDKTYTDENRDNVVEFRNQGNGTVRSDETVTIEGSITYPGQSEPLTFTYTGKLLSQNNKCKNGYDLSISSITVNANGEVIVEVVTKYQLTYDKYNYVASVKLAENKTTSVVTVPVITKTTTDINYSLVGNYIKKGYNYEVTYATDILEDRYSFEASISHKSKPTTKEIDVWAYYIQTMEIVEKGGDEENKEETKEEVKEETKEEIKETVKLEEAPKTGNKVNYNYINLLAITVLVIIKKLVK